MDIYVFNFHNSSIMALSPDDQSKCPPNLYKYKNHACRFCPFRSVYKHVVKLHEWRKHVRQSKKDPSPNNVSALLERSQAKGSLSSSSTTPSSNPIPKTPEQVHNNLDHLAESTTSERDSSPSNLPSTSSNLERTDQTKNNPGNFNHFSDPMIEKNTTFDLRLVENPKVAIFGPSRAGFKFFSFFILLNFLIRKI